MLKNRSVKTVFIMMVATVLSKVLGMLRSVLLAAHYGTSWQAEAFVTASRIPLAAFDLFLSAAILGCFIPIYTSLAEKSRQAGKSGEEDRFAGLFFSAVSLFTGLLTLLGILFAPQLIAVIGVGLDAQTAALATTLLRIMFPMILFTAGAYTLVGVMQSKGSFILPAMISAISNGLIILYFLLFDRMLGERGIYGLAAAYLLAWLVQLITLLIPLLRAGTKLKLSLKLNDPDLKRAMKMLPPIMVGSWLSPVGIVVGTSFSTLVGSGGAAVFDYANNLYVIISGVLVYSICNYIFPTLSRLGSLEDEDGYRSMVGDGLSGALMLVLPFMAAVLVLAGEGVSVLYQGEKFSAEAAGQTAAALAYMTAGMPAYAVIEIGSRAFYAKGKTGTPVLAALCGVAATVLFSLIFRFCGAGEELGVGAYTLAFALGQWTAAAVLLCRLGRRILIRPLLWKIGKVVGAAALSFCAMALCDRLIGHDPYTSGKISNLLVALIMMAAGAAVYLPLLYFGVLKKAAPKEE